MTISYVCYWLLFFLYSLMPYLYLWFIPGKIVLLMLSLFFLLPEKRLVFITNQAKYGLFVIIIMTITLIGSILGRQILDDYRDFVIGFFILLITPTIVQNQRQLNGILFASIVAASINSLFAVLQSLNIEFFYQAKMYFISQSRLSEAFSLQHMIDYSRKSGLHTSVISFSYSLCIAIPAAFRFWILEKRTLYKLSYLLINLLLIFGLFISATRSAIAVCIISIIALLYLYRKHYSKSLLILPMVGIIVIIFVSYRYMPNVDELVSSIHDKMASISEDVRLITWKCGIKTGLDNLFFGVHGEYNEVANAICLEKIYVKGSILVPHNIFINIFAYYGIFGLSTVVLLYYRLVKEISYLAKEKEVAINAILLGVIVAAYTFNGIFHSRNLINSIELWFVMGMVYTLYYTLEENVILVSKL